MGASQKPTFDVDDIRAPKLVCSSVPHSTTEQTILFCADTKTSRRLVGGFSILRLLFAFLVAKRKVKSHKIVLQWHSPKTQPITPKIVRHKPIGV